MQATMTILKGLPTGYNRDLQEDKETLFDSVDTLAVVLPAVAGAVRTAEFQPDRIEAALDTQLLATDLADYLVRAGVPFRKAHEAVATVVRMAEEQGVVLDGLELDDFRAAHPSFGSDVLDVFSWDRSVEARSASGGTARGAVQAQIEAAAGKLGAYLLAAAAHPPFRSPS